MHDALTGLVPGVISKGLSGRWMLGAEDTWLTIYRPDSVFEKAEPKGARSRDSSQKSYQPLQVRCLVPFKLKKANVDALTR